MKREIEHLELFFGKAFPCGESEKGVGEPKHQVTGIHSKHWNNTCFDIKSFQDHPWFRVHVLCVSVIWKSLPHNPTILVPLMNGPPI